MAEAGAGILTGLGIGLGYGTLTELTRLGLLWGKWKLINALDPNMVKDAFSATMQSILSAEKDSVSGLSSKGTIDVMWDFVNRTIDMSLMIDESIASQMFIQMLQQSIAYAIHSSHAGAIGTLGNVYSGSTYLSPSESSYVAEESDRVDKELKGFLGAEVGQNIPTLAFSLTRGANRQVADATRSLMRNIDVFLDEWNDLALSYYRYYHSMARERLGNALRMKETAVDRAYGLLEQVGNEHLARLSEQLDSLTGAKAWFDSGLMSDDELKEISIRVDLERDASENNYDGYKIDIIGSIAQTIVTWDAKITQSLGDLTDTENKYNVLFNNMFTLILDDVSRIVDAVAFHCEGVILDVCAYRNIKPSVTYQVGAGIPEYPSGEGDFEYDEGMLIHIPPALPRVISFPLGALYPSPDVAKRYIIPPSVLDYLSTISGELYDTSIINEDNLYIIGISAMDYIGTILSESYGTLYGESSIDVSTFE